jgi:hypothetical protein
MDLVSGEVVQVVDRMSSRGYAPVKNGVYYFVREAANASEYYEVNGDNELRFFDFEKRESRALALVRRPMQLGVTVSPDGRYILYSQIDGRVEDLMLVQNFR